MAVPSCEMVILRGSRPETTWETTLSVPVSIFDLDGAGGMGANDVSLWLGDYGSLQYYECTIQ